MIELYMKRIHNATGASIRAKSPTFRKLWANIAHKLNENMIKKFGQ